MLNMPQGVSISLIMYTLAMGLCLTMLYIYEFNLNFECYVIFQ